MGQLSDDLSGPPFAPHVPPLKPGRGGGAQKKAQLVFRESKYFQETESQKKKAQAAQLVYCESDFQETNRQGEPMKEHKEYSNIQGGRQGKRDNEIQRDTSRYMYIEITTAGDV